MEKKFQFENKVYYKNYKRKKISSKRIVITIILIVFLLIIALINRSFMTPGLLCIIFLLLSLISGPSREIQNEGYNHVQADLIVDSNGIRLVNKNFDKLDGFGLRNEETYMTAGNIENIYYSNELVSLCVVGNGTMNMKFIQKNKQHEIKAGNMYIYAEPDMINEMRQTIESILNMEVKTVK